MQPTVWTIGMEGITVKVMTCRDDHGVIFDTYHGPNEQHASHIVHCVNTHDELISALECVVTMLENGQVLDRVTDYKWLNEALIKVLAKGATT